MNICFRVDSSTEIGSGHVMRCLTLADEFKKNGDNVVFISRLHEGNLCNYINEKGYEVLALEAANQDGEVVGVVNHNHAKWLGVTQEVDLRDSKEMIINSKRKFDWIVIDHYAIDKAWEQPMRDLIPNVMVIDDIADRGHDCDILLDQNFYQNADTRYSDLVPKQCHLLLGPKYALLRNEFIRYHSMVIEQKNTYSALVFYGGSDPTNETIKAMNVINKHYPELHLHVVVGPSNPNKDFIKEQCKSEKFTFHYNINYMAKLMHEVDFAICAGGSTTWERYCVGTPAIVTAVAYNQVELCENIQKLDIDSYIGISEVVTEQTIEDEVKSFIMNDFTLKGIKGKEVVDGKGKKRVLDIIKFLSHK